MIGKTLIEICSYSILLAAIIGLIRFRKINRTYHPFIFITVLSLLSEIASEVFIKFFKTNAVVVNVFILVEFLLWLWQFKRWDGFARTSKWIYPILAIGFLSFWLVENIFFDRLFVFNSVFTLISAFILVFLAIDQVNRLIVEEKRTLIRNSTFLICCGVLIFHTYRIMVESFYVMKINQSNSFLSNIFIILVIVNLFVNLLYALATLWIPTRQRFTMRY